MGLINDYGQTLEASDRAQLLGYISALEEKGVTLVYLASWRDPFGNPQRYAAEVFRAWGLAEGHLLLVCLRGEDRRWRVAIHAGGRVSLPAAVEELRAKAELEANRIRPGYAVVRFAAELLSALGKEGPAAGRAGSFPWKYLLFGALGLLLFGVLARRLCPRCGRPLRRVRSLSGIIWACPRCRYTRAGLRWGRRPGGRRVVFP